MIKITASIDGMSVNIFSVILCSVRIRNLVS